MLKQLLMIAARQFLAQRRAGPGLGPGPGPGPGPRRTSASAGGFKQRAAQQAIRWVMSRIAKR